MELLADGRVKIRYRGWGGNRNATVSRRNLQLAPEGVAQPKKPAESTTIHKPRVWSDATGNFKIEAVFLGVDSDRVKLRRVDGIEIAVPIDRLNRDDQEYVKQTIASRPLPDNPFEPK